MLAPNLIYPLFRYSMMQVIPVSLNYSFLGFANLNLI